MAYTYTNANRKHTGQPEKREAAGSKQDTAFLASAAQGGAPGGHRVDLPDVMRLKMENAFGTDLSAVRLFENQRVADAGAEAVTQGSSIAFAPGKLDFSSRKGQALLGHEISHVVSQARGEVTGGGFLNDRALETRADREGAMAASGQQVYPGGVTGALSSASSASAAGPMQARKDKEEGDDYRGTKTANPAARSRQQVDQDQAYVGAFGQELEQDTGWDMDSQMEKRGFFSRNLGKYFYNNDSKLNIAKNVGIGAGLAIGGLPMLIGKGIWKGLTAIGGSLKKSNQEAVDQFNNYDADYRKMGKWDKFKSFAASPIAWMTASHRKKGTQERNLRRAKINAAANLWRSQNEGRFDNADASFDALKEIPAADRRADTGGRAQQDNSTTGYAALGMTGAKFGTMGLKFLSGAKEGSTTAAGMDAVSSDFGAGAAALNMLAAATSARNQDVIGDRAGAAAAGLKAASYGSSAIASGMQSVMNVAGGLGSSLATNPYLTTAVPALGIVSGTANAAAGATQFGAATSSRTNMTKLMEEMGGPLQPDQMRLRNTFEQVHEVEKGNQAEGALKTIGGATQAAGSALGMTGVASLIGTIVGGVGTAINMGAEKLGAYMRNAAGEEQLDKDVQFSKQVQIVKRRFAKLNLSDAEAEDLVLQSMGMYSGDKKEAVQRMSMKRAHALTTAANDRTDANHEIAQKGAAGMGLRRINGQYSLQAVAQKLGFDKDKTWQEQMRATRRKGAYYNPFTKQLA